MLLANAIFSVFGFQILTLLSNRCQSFTTSSCPTDRNELIPLLSIAVTDRPRILVRCARLALSLLDLFSQKKLTQNCHIFGR